MPRYSLPALALALAGALAAACTSTPPAASPATSQPTATQPPGTGQPPTTSPPPAQSAEPSPGVSLDPALSDAGVVARVTLPDDTRGGRTGTHLIVGQASAGSDCSVSFEGDEFTAVAWVDDAEDGELTRLSVTVPAADVPEGIGATQDIDGRVSFDFISASGVGTLYTGDSSGDDDGQSTINVARVGDLLVFDFSGLTWDDVAFNGQAMCVVD